MHCSPRNLDRITSRHIRLRSRLTGGSGARGSNEAAGGEGGNPPPRPPNPKKEKPKKELTVAKAADQVFKKSTLKISEAEGLEQSLRKGGMCLGGRISIGIKENLHHPLDPVV